MPPLLEVIDLHTEFRTGAGIVRAVDGISYSVEPGETVAIVGESGSGKSVSALSILRLIPDPPGRITRGEIRFAGRDIMQLSDAEMRGVRGGEIGMVFQEPMTSLNPVLTIGRQITETVEQHRGMDRTAAHKRAIELLGLVGISDAERRLRQYPHQLSGGMRQRIMIAIALACDPKLIIADEPTTALDVTIQAQILELIRKLRRETGTSVILITHDLGVVAGMTDHIIVMYAGKVFEQAPTRELFACPGNPYTKGLLRSVPDPTAEQGALYQIPGLPPDVAHLPPGCPFAPRCDRAEEICRKEFPPFAQLNPDHHSLCHFAEEIYGNSCAEREARAKRAAAAPEAKNQTGGAP